MATPSNKTLADGRKIFTYGRCNFCGLEYYPDPDKDRANAGLLRCARGHVSLDEKAVTRLDP